MKKLNVTLEDRPVDIELAQYKRMFIAAATDLGIVAKHLRLDPNACGAEPIIETIKEIQQANTALVCALDRVHDVLNGVYVDDVAAIVNSAILAAKKRTSGAAYLTDAEIYKLAAAATGKEGFSEVAFARAILAAQRSK